MPPQDAVARAAPLPTSLMICGKGRIATGALSFAVHYGVASGLPFQIVAAPNREDSGIDTWQPSLRRAAGALGVACMDPEALEPEAGLVLVSLEYDRIIRVARFASTRLFNIHFSDLPRYRGVFTSMWPILKGESAVGVTLHYMDPGVDTGAIIDQVRMPLPPYMSSRQLYDVFLDEGLALFQRWLPALIATLPHAVAQDASQSSSFTRRSLDVRQVEIDLSLDTASVSAFVRAFSFPEYQRPTVGGRPIRSCAVIPACTSEPPGTALHSTEYSTSFAVANGGIVELAWS